MKWPHIHWWRKEFLTSIVHEHTWALRTCRCGKMEVRCGVLDNCKWRDVNDPWVYDFERVWFFEALGKTPKPLRRRP